MGLVVHGKTLNLKSALPQTNVPVVVREILKVESVKIVQQNLQVVDGEIT